MTWIGTVLRRLAQACYRLGNFLDGLLPSLLAPAQLSRLLREHYVRSYGHASDHPERDFDPGSLEPWEVGVLDRHGIRAGSMLVLGCGMGREALGIARRGVAVTGIDTNHAALRVAHRLARASGLPARFLQADLLRLPHTHGSFGHVMLSCLMYSAIPGRAVRQAWLRSVIPLLAPGGLVILGFLIERRPGSRLKALCRRFNRLLCRLPGANAAYQPGDDCESGHFLHAFQDEAELRAELGGAGVAVRELDWGLAYAVVARTAEGCGPSH